MAASDTMLREQGPVQEDLSDEQIEAMLARATERLQQKGEVAKTGEKSLYTFPKLNAGKLEKPYVSSKADVASVDASRLLDEKDRKQANGIRKVEDPLTAKKAALEVSLVHMLCRIYLAMRKIFPIFS